MNLAILGAGAWGTALGIAMSAQHRTDPVVPGPAAVRAYSRRGPQQPISSRSCNCPGALRITADSGAAAFRCRSGHCCRSNGGIARNARLVAQSPRRSGRGLAVQGIRAGQQPSFPIRLPPRNSVNAYPFAALSGPSFAGEVARGLPAAVTLASADSGFAALAARELHTGRLRVYSSDDLAGVETGGAVKNVIAIAAGVCDGLKLGYSARAALITRGLAEMTRLGLAPGRPAGDFHGPRRSRRPDADRDLRLVAKSPRRSGTRQRHGAWRTSWPNSGMLPKGLQQPAKCLRLALKSGWTCPSPRRSAAFWMARLPPASCRRRACCSASQSRKRALTTSPCEAVLPPALRRPLPPPRWTG